MGVFRCGKSVNDVTDRGQALLAAIQTIDVQPSLFCELAHMSHFSRNSRASQLLISDHPRILVDSTILGARNANWHSERYAQMLTSTASGRRHSLFSPPRDSAADRHHACYIDGESAASVDSYGMIGIPNVRFPYQSRLGCSAIPRSARFGFDSFERQIHDTWNPSTLPDESDRRRDRHDDRPIRNGRTTRAATRGTPRSVAVRTGPVRISQSGDGQCN